jgi:NitT/TauT family transport system substrate-binding protein
LTKEIAMIDRRRFLAALPAAALAATPAGRLLAAPAPLPELILMGPPAGPSIVAAQAVESGALRSIAERVSFRVWRTPDEVRAGFASGKTAASILPTYVAANLYNRGVGVRLVNTMTDGVLYICATDPALDALAKLKGRKLAVPFRNDMPDHLLDTAVRAVGLDPGRDFTIEYAGTPPEAMQLLLAGRVEAALLQEPGATAAIMQGTRAGKRVERVIDLQKAWSAATGGPSAVPQAGLAVSAAFAQAAGAEGLAALNAALAEAATWVRANPASAGKVGAAYLELPAPVIERSIPYSNLTVRAASAARPALDALFKTLAARDPGILGGELPDDGLFAA